MSKVRSAKGAMVDFDLIQIKQSIASDPAPTDVAMRQGHIDQRLRRRMRTINKSTTPVQHRNDVNVDAKSPTTSPSTVKHIDVIEPSTSIDETTSVDEAPAKKTTQKARRK